MTEKIDLRDWFAGQALAGQMIIPGGHSPERIARLAYSIADAMLAEREKRPPADPAGMIA